jgi:Zn-dependent protease with chaperone function
MQTNLYPKTPLFVPVDLTTPSKSYKKHVWIASAALLLFIFLYLGLSTWFLYKSYRLFANTFGGTRDGFLGFIVAVLMGFLGVFMLKALFFIVKRDKSEDIEIKKEDEPQLFEFINKVADEAKAPRPHKVFLSNQVNACVFYDISVINLFFPTRKNLEIGLGLVNTLNLGEFKSILAHEFGHFAQKSMIIGRWVYIAHKVAYQIVAKRDGFDAFLSGLSRVDFRIAWIGWLLSIIVWSIRAVSETFFKLVLITQRALSREMEFHADLVAVSLTGSDSLIHSLYKLGAADEAYDEAIAFVNKQLKKNMAVNDVFAIQSNSIKHMAVVLNNAAYGLSPKIEGRDGSSFKVFKEQIAQAPKMWSTHPANIDREKNAKKIYIKSEVDERSSWLLFKDAAKTKNKITLSLYTHLKIKTSPLETAESIALHDKEFQRSFLLPKYRGVYLNRPVLLAFKNVASIYTPLDIATITAQFPLLYPVSLQKQLEQWKALVEEIELLEGIHKKVLDANEGKINYRNREISRKDLPGVIEQTKKEEKVAIEKINEHDKQCRNIHYAAAKIIGNGWEEYLISITSLVHYCEHTQKNITERSRFFYETLAVVSKIRSVGASDISPLLNAANDIYELLQTVFTNGKKIKLSTQILDKLDGKEFHELLEEFQLTEATRDNINSWINVVASWIGLAFSALHTLREAALDELLLTEAFIENAYLTAAIAAEQAPPAIIVSDNYVKYDPTSIREVTQKPDLLSRFYNADGLFPTIGRLAVAASIILFAVFFSYNIGNSNVVLYNGLPIDVLVHINNKTVNVSAFTSIDLQIEKSEIQTIYTTTQNGDSIESFSAKSSSDSHTYIYNIANAGLMYRWTATYSTSNFFGSSENNTTELLGAIRWMIASADYYFEEPPQTISLKSGESASKQVISVYKAHPSELVSIITDSLDLTNFITAHALWEPATSATIFSWLNAAASLKTFPAILSKRLAVNPYEVASLRMQQDMYTENEKIKICEQHHQLYLKNLNNADLYYINVRCMADGSAQDSAFLLGHEKWPTNEWLAFAVGYTFVQKEEWKKAIDCFNVSYQQSPALREAIIEDMKRIYHLLGEESSMISLADVQLPYIKFIQSIESCTEQNDEEHLFAYKLLSEGKIQAAIDYTDTDTNRHNAILRLAALSDGASQEVIQQALALPTANLNIYNITPAIALLAKENKSTDVMEEPLKNTFGNYADSIVKFIRLVKENKIMEAEKILAPLRSELKGNMCLIGVAILENKSPPRWKQLANKLLFINERPYTVEFEKENKL